MMLIYEVNLDISLSIFEEFLIWLRTHINEILKFKGFTKAELLFCLDEDPAESKKISIHYYIDSYEHYHEYITLHAPKMREDALNKFGGNFSTSRRIMDIRSIINK